jgi:tetratricopeptide (TPR) repeat protein
MKASRVEIGERTIPVASLGQENPLPMVGRLLESPYGITPPIPQEIVDGSRYGHPRNLFPYQLQDDYGRERSDRALVTVTLENELLRAVLLPELGGRLWELLDKRTGKDLVHTPPAIQFANLALRNAWFAGGIEWNIGTRGHSPTTCSPLHTALVSTPDGQTMVRMWEFERLRRVVFTIDVWLPGGSPLLFTAVRITNSAPTAVPMYWWTNAAVPEDDATRVIAPASSAFRTDYGEGITRTAPADDDGIDCTWPSRNPAARDFFFDLPSGGRPWIMSVDADGDGLAMLSTPRLRGRKLFTWGRGPGGNRWQNWLNPGDGRYFEIQAGLAQTQFEHVPLPGRSLLTWTEAYGNASADPRLAHSADWSTAVQHCGARVESLLDGRPLDSVHALMRGWAGAPVARRVVTGTGWGALESRLRLRRGEASLGGAEAPFEADSLGEDQQPWLNLLEAGTFDGARTFVAGDDWQGLLRDAPATPQSLLHLAVMAHAEGRIEEAAACYRRSLDAGPSSGAHRGLALLALDDDAEGGAEHYELACSLDPDNPSLLIEAAAALLAHELALRALILIERAQTAAESGRLALLRATALADTGDTAGAAALLTAGFDVADLREGENSVHSLWQRVLPGEPVPARYQFDMRRTGPSPVGREGGAA